MSKSSSGSKLAGVCMLLLAPVTLALPSGDPTVPTLLGIIIAITTAAFGVQVFKTASTASLVFLILLIVVALIFMSVDPLYLRPGRNMNSLGWLVYLGIVKPGGTLVLAVIALGAICRVWSHDAVEALKDARRCRECGMLPPQHKAWCTITNTKA